MEAIMNPIWNHLNALLRRAAYLHYLMNDGVLVPHGAELPYASSPEIILNCLMTTLDYVPVSHTLRHDVSHIPAAVCYDFWMLYVCYGFWMLYARHLRVYRGYGYDASWFCHGAFLMILMMNCYPLYIY
jgi:hypothetical protein